MTIKRGKSSQKSFSSPLTTRSSRKRSSTGKFSEKSIEQNYSEPAPLEEHDKMSHTVLHRNKISPLPETFPKLEHVKLPFVRDVGVKAVIRKLSEVFGCKEYELNLIQFWFLDMITDCLWRTQDEFQFPEQQQKIVLEWILYTFNLIRGCFIFCCHLSFNSTLVAQHMQLSRKRLFKVIREALSVAEDYVETGCPSVPLPKQLFTLKPMENFIDSSEASNSEVSLELSSKNDSFLAIKFPEKTKIFKLPKKVCAWTSEDECMSSSVETLSEEELPVVEREKSEDLEEEATDDYSLDEETDFYKPDMRTPPRFQPSKESLDESSSTFLDSNVDSSDDESGDASWVASQHRLPKVPCSSTVEVENRNSAPSEKRKEEEVLQAWFDYHLWQVRKHDMEDPSKGASFSVETMKEPSETLIDKNERDRIELASYLRGKEEETKELRENVFVNTCVLLAIKQFIFDYFYESFHFFLLTTAFRQRHNFITQKLNTEWCVPKNFKGQLKKPVPRKIKKPKIEKERKPKKEKKEKKEKKDKVSSKKDKKSTKSDKKSDKASKKKEKQDKKVHLAKEPSKTKEEKEEMARMQRELKEQEEERRKADENKRFMFPLTEAATDKFFQSIFEDWIPPKAREKSGKLKTDKGGKEAKRGKSKESGRSEKSKDGKKKGSKEGKGKKK